MILDYAVAYVFYTSMVLIKIIVKSGVLLELKDKGREEC